MLPDRVSNPGPLTYESGALPIALRGPASFQTLISQIHQYFLLKNVKSFCNAKAFLIFSTKNFSVFGYNVVNRLTS